MEKTEHRGRARPLQRERWLPPEVTVSRRVDDPVEGASGGSVSADPAPRWSPIVHPVLQIPQTPILIGGCGRSGTTLLLSLLSAHPRIRAVSRQGRNLETDAMCHLPSDDRRQGIPPGL